MTASNTAAPDVSVLICTRNRADELIHALRTVLANSYPSFDVTVVDQSDGNDTAKVVEQCRAEFGDRVAVHYVPTETRGAGPSRNLALQLGRGRILAFTDDDCLVPADWISYIAGEFEKDPELAMAYGQVHAPKEYAERTDIVVPSMYFDQYRILEQHAVFGMTANVALRRTVVDRIGGFDIVLGAGGPFGGGEDFDFTYRALNAGLKVVADPGLVVIHKSFRSKDRWVEVLYQYGRGDGAFLGKHARCGDPWAVKQVYYKMVHHFLWSTARAVLRRGGPGDWSYLRGYRAGLKDSRAYAVDKASCLYAADGQSPPRAKRA